VIAVIQRVARAEVRVDGEVVGRIGRGLLVLTGLETGDGDAELADAVRKIPALRVFEDEAGKMNLGVRDVGGELLVVSQFTLAASLERGNRPSFDGALGSEAARPLFERFLELLERDAGCPIATGRFGADMKVELVNDGPVTLIWRSKSR